MEEARVEEATAAAVGFVQELPHHCYHQVQTEAARQAPSSPTHGHVVFYSSHSHYYSHAYSHYDYHVLVQPVHHP